MLHIHSFIFGPFQENTYLVYNESGKATLIDPGCYDPEEKAELNSYVEKQQLQIERIVNTHCHIDHVLGNQFSKETFKAPLMIPPGEDETFKAVKVYAPNYGFPTYSEASVDEYLPESGTIEMGGHAWEVLLVPGHSPGHLAFYEPQSKSLIGGDVLFNGSIGRTDLPGGDFDTLIKSIHQHIFKLDDEVVVYSGHGPTTTVGHEKRTNPFCAIRS
jgi:glyoxylase-like metal-dependent hydrolase (beta-lactamase superfamily II)